MKQQLTVLVNPGGGCAGILTTIDGVNRLIHDIRTTRGMDDQVEICYSKSSVLEGNKMLKDFVSDMKAMGSEVNIEADIVEHEKQPWGISSMLLSSDEFKKINWKVI